MSRCKLWSCRSFALVLLALLACGLPPTSWAAAPTQDVQARLRCRIEPTPLTVGGTGNLIVEILDVQKLYGYDLTLTYNAQQVQIQDVDAQKADVNLDLSNALVSPDFVVYNRAAEGTIQLALTQLAPNTAQSGSGELARAPFIAAVTGAVTFSFSAATFSNDDGAAIALTIENCASEVVAAAPTATATATATALPPATATSIVTQPAAAGAAIPTATAIPTLAPPTNTPVPPTATFTPLPQPTDLPTQMPTATASPVQTVLASSTPSTLATATAVVRQFEETQPPPPSPTPPVETATPVLLPTDTPPTVTNTPVPATTSSVAPSSTPIQPQVTPEASASVQVVLPLIGQEMLSPPQLTTPTGESNAATSEAVEAAGNVTSAIVSTPLIIAQRVESPARAQVVVQQPAPTASTVEQSYLREAAWLLLLAAAVFGLGAWHLRRP